MEDLPQKETLLDEATEVLRSLVSEEPIHENADGFWCVYCNGAESSPTMVQHEATCSWLRAKSLLEKLEN